MRDAIPTVYTEQWPPDDEDDVLVPVRVPTDVADELKVATVWLSLELNHQLSIAALRRALLLGGLTNLRAVLGELRAELLTTVEQTHPPTPQR
jgi:hypothetical protein